MVMDIEKAPASLYRRLALESIWLQSPHTTYHAKISLCGETMKSTDAGDTSVQGLF